MNAHYDAWRMREASHMMRWIRENQQLPLIDACADAAQFWGLKFNSLWSAYHAPSI